MEIKHVGEGMPLFWKGSPRAIAFEKESIKEKLTDTEKPCYIIKDFKGRIGISNQGELVSAGRGLQVLAIATKMTAHELGDCDFKSDYNIKYAYKTGAMANGIASADLVVAMGKADLLASYGAAGLLPDRIEKDLDKIQLNLQDKTFAVNLIHSPIEEALEEGAVNIFLKKQIRVVEASAYLSLTEHIVHYRVSGLERDEQGNIQIRNKIIAKISRKEVATLFLLPPPTTILETLIAKSKITRDQAEMATRISIADDITVEADSGGHTDNRPLVTLLPIIIKLRDELSSKTTNNIRVGAAGGISTPESALAAFMMGAAYIVTGSVNQSCVEAGTSDHVKKLLQTVDSTDVMGAPASDMFEMGVDLQVVKRGTMFGPRARKLYEYYKRYNSIEEIPELERLKIEKQIFRRPLEAIWMDCIDFFEQRDPEQINRAKNNPHRKMALIFRWYLGLSSNWANAGTPDRELDYQIWCGPSMGGFNQWVKGSHLEHYQNRKVVEIAEHIMHGAAYLFRIQNLKNQGIVFEKELETLPINAQNYRLEESSVL